ncbi:hypothetical protein [Roseateles chitinivorans]|uniref:hypothetical protein n=1 Tax=Roseateles chitinivorans TaxID=2917965 RepID=UPI003D67C300
MSGSELRTASLRCEQCDGDALSDAASPASMESFRCQNCGHAFRVHVQHIAAPHDLGVVTYKAYVAADSFKAARWNRLHVPKVFHGRSNFHLSDMEAQFAKGLAKWDLGYYSGNEVKELRAVAEKFELQVEFVQVV